MAKPSSSESSDERTLPPQARPQAVAEEIRASNIGDLPIQVGLAVEKGFPHQGASATPTPSNIDPATGDQRDFRATVPNPDFILLAGMFARVRMKIGKPYQALLVPEAAVFTDQGRKFLYVLDDQDRVELRPVTLGQPQEDLRVVREGVKAGDRIILHPQKDLKPGTTIKPRSSSRWLNQRNHR